MTSDDSTSPQTPNPTGPILVTDPGQLIAAAPHLIGFYPTESLVVLVLRGETIAVTIRVSLPPQSWRYRPLAEQTVALAQRHHATSAAVLIISASRAPRLAGHLQTEFAVAGIPAETYGMATIAAGVQWFSYGADEHGVIPDPSASLLAMASVMRGLVTYPSRDHLTATLSPDPDEALARRTALIAQHRTSTEASDPAATEVQFKHVQREVERAGERGTPLTDEEVAKLAVVLSDTRIRDRCLTFTSDRRAAAAEQLWTQLTRQCPAPQRAEPAVLLAMSAYVRGDGALATIALDRALDARPDHRLAQLLRTALNHGTPPTVIADLVDASREWSV